MSDAAPTQNGKRGYEKSDHYKRAGALRGDRRPDVPPDEKRSAGVLWRLRKKAARIARFFGSRSTAPMFDLWLLLELAAPITRDAKKRGIVRINTQRRCRG